MKGIPMIPGSIGTGTFTFLNRKFVCVNVGDEENNYIYRFLIPLPAVSDFKKNIDKAVYELEHYNEDVGEWGSDELKTSEHVE